MDYKAKKQIGTFKCPFCGFSYARNINSEDIYKIGKVKAFGFLWENKLMELLKVRELNIRELARLMKCDSKTIIKYSEKLQNCISKKNGRSANKIIEQGYRERYSIEMLALIKNHPEYTRSKIREKLKKQYAWFYRNDRQWINDNLPIGVSNINNENKVKQRIDWSQRDNEIYLQVKNKYEELMNIKKAIRITKTIIGNKLGVASLLEHYSYKLPKTSKYIIEITETVEEFQVRRVNNICNYMLAEGRQIKRWKVMRLAGLRKTCSARVIERIDYFIQLDESKII